VVAVTFLALLGAAAVRSTPGVLMVPLEQAFGWSPATISLAVSVNLLLFGLLGPFSAAAMQRFGVRRTVLGALALLSLTVGASSFMTAPWQLVLSWGLFVGIGSGMVAVVFGATVINRWFITQRGLAMGIVTAANATGQLLFLPVMAAIAESGGWKPVVWCVAIGIAAVIPLIWFLLPEQPQNVGLSPFGAVGDVAAPPQARGNPLTIAFTVLGRGVKSRDFWLLFASFFVCGASTNGLVGTHLISYCLDQGIPEVSSAGLLAAMGFFDIFGTTFSGWLTDRYNPRVLLSMYYGLRGLSLLYLPFSNFDFFTLSIFAAFYGLDWIATVPPTVRLANEIFGKQDAPVIFGWIFAGHQFGAASIAFTAGLLRGDLGSYLTPFLISGTLCLSAAMFVLWIGRSRGRAGRLAEAT
jgi:predicted MFS family arabinose efflux permease